jgi:outer membrane protein OmpA-like peptidoglycan-associated protein
LRFFGLASLTSLSALAASLISSSAFAQSGVGVLANRFDPSEKGSDWFENESLDYRSNLRPAFGVVVDYAKDPVVLRNSDGSSNSSLISDMLYLHVGASIALWERLRLGFELPLELAETGNTVTLASGIYKSPSGSAVGDLRLYGEYDHPFRLSIGAQVYLPSGRPDEDAGTGETRFVPRLMVAGDVDVFTYAVRFGYEVYPSNDYLVGHPVGDNFVMGAAVGLKLLEKQLTVGPEISSYTLVSNAFQSATSPTEVLLGAHYRIEDFMLGLGAGTSFNTGDAVGSPSFRLLAGLEWHPSIPVPPPPSDRDQDGIPDEFDACPETPGPYSEMSHINGCPPDRDGDGIPDDVDACPDLAGVRTNDPKTNGCPPPPPDRDHDGIIDAEDACPDVPGVKTSDPKTNGCPPPDPDRDKDGIPNEVDACPDIAGPANEDPKKNGCPLARVENGQIKITEQVKFATGSAQILKESDTVLNAVLAILTAHPEIEKLRVEGYTDNKGAPAYNKNLSKQRAASVKNWLVLHKVDPKRLDSEGFGEERPIDDNKTDAGRANNRRVEFHIGEKAAPPPAGAEPAPLKKK